MKQKTSLTWLQKVKNHIAAYWRASRWHKILLSLVVAAVVSLSGLYNIARWYIASQSSKPLVLGASFVPAYAESLGLNAKETMDALITDVGVRHFRLVSYWDQLEPTEGVYDFSLLDWQFKKAEAVDAKITLSLGLRQPRWPECHMPAWAENQTVEQWQPALEKFISATVERYKMSASLDSYQLENEFFLKGFGHCTNFDRGRLVAEYNLVKKLDPARKIIVARSNNYLGLPIGKPTPDEFGIAIYRRVWDATLTHRYLQYPFPAWSYAALAGTQKLLTGRNMIIHELQTEPWAPRGQDLQNISLDEQNKSFNAERFKGVVDFGKATGMREIYLWGSEYWYYRLSVLGDPSVWNQAKQEFRISH